MLLHAILRVRTEPLSGLRVSAVVVHKDEPLLERCVLSLREQTERVEVVVADGGSSPERLEAARNLADKLVVEPGPIGRTRVRGFLEASGEIILSCDADSVYCPTYAEEARRSLSEARAVRGVLRPLGSASPLALVDLVAQHAFVYECALALRRSAVFEAGLHELEFTNPRADVGQWVLSRLAPPVNPRMVVWTRLPTWHAVALAKLAGGLALAWLGFRASGL